MRQAVGGRKGVRGMPVGQKRDVMSIVLTKEEVALLKKLKKGRILETKENHDDFIPLLKAGVAKQEHLNWRETQDSKTIPAIMDWYITDDGRHFLAYRSEQWKRAVITPIIVSVLANILWRLLEWLLPMAKEWLFSTLAL